MDGELRGGTVRAAAENGASDGATAPRAEAGEAPRTGAPAASTLAPEGAAERNGAAPESYGPRRFFNRELSWIDFNQRVFAEAANPARPLLERVRFLAHYCSNLDEFMMVRLPALRSKVKAGVLDPGPDGTPPLALLAQLRRLAARCLDDASRLWQDVLVPALAGAGLRVTTYGALSAAQQERLRSYFEESVFPVCTPLGFDPAHPFPFISNQSTNLAVLLTDPELGRRFARLKVPSVVPRLVVVPQEQDASGALSGRPPALTFIWLEELLRAHLASFF
ncbi:MAG TPA: RNA degradosome polyphosphate kinase, partial [Dehalococcoidia bacterium]|nr:RNA degradosome polyphosphate kinase [Dehalococcoidia bacterium]